jgi:hypothetical protein
LKKMPRVARLGPPAFEPLSSLVAAVVLEMPYADLPLTRAMQPLQRKEYLATDKPVVVRDLPARRPARYRDLARSPEEFAGCVRRRLKFTATWAAGFIGSPLCPYLSSVSWDTVVRDTLLRTCAGDPDEGRAAARSSPSDGRRALTRASAVAFLRRPSCPLVLTRRNARYARNSRDNAVRPCSGSPAPRQGTD